MHFHLIPVSRKWLWLLMFVPFFNSSTILSNLSFQVFQKRLPPEAVDLVCRFFQYSPNLRCTAVSTSFFSAQLNAILKLQLINLLSFYVCYYSWKPVFTPSLMNWGIPTPDFQMVAHFLHYLILNLKVLFLLDRKSYLNFLISPLNHVKWRAFNKPNQVKYPILQICMLYK